jgi:hypothetical protein
MAIGMRGPLEVDGYQNFEGYSPWSSWFKSSRLLPSDRISLSNSSKMAFLDFASGFLIEGMGNVFKLSVFAPLAGHGYKEAIISLDDFQVSNNKAIVDGDSDVGFEAFFVNGEYLNIGDFHHLLLPGGGLLCIS